ncbi:MAG: FxsA family protein [Desulfobacteraceae bacterium]
MLFKLFLAFTLIPVIELYLLIKVGTLIGSLNTVLLVIFTGFAGAWLARMEGMYTMLQVRRNLDQGIMPKEELLDALIIFCAGAVLITPGLLTDIAGLLLLWPVTRKRFKFYLRKKIDDMIQDRHIDIHRL